MSPRYPTTNAGLSPACAPYDAAPHTRTAVCRPRFPLPTYAARHPLLPRAFTASWRSCSLCHPKYYPRARVEEQRAHCCAHGALYPEIRHHTIVFLVLSPFVYVIPPTNGPAAMTYTIRRPATMLYDEYKSLPSAGTCSVRNTNACTAATANA